MFLWLVLAHAAWRALYRWATRPPGCEPYAMTFDSVDWKIRLDFGTPLGPNLDGFGL